MLKIENRGCNGNGSEKLKKICIFVHLSTEVKNGQKKWLQIGSEIYGWVCK